MTVLTAQSAGNSEKVLAELNQQLSKIAETIDAHTEVQGVVHSLNFPKSEDTTWPLEFNKKLAALYQKFSWPVLGGDTSSGPELNVIVCILTV